MSPTDPALPVRTIRRLLLAWYSKHQRDLPWRRTRDPYRIWVSEIMLQQTRVASAIGYYQRFLERFPSIPELAAAPEQELLTAWAGLGYYARVRNLQKAANKIVELGAFPRDYASLRALAGIGDYTAAAIASIAFDLPHAALDGNVIRVLSRLTAERGNVASTTVRKRLRAAADRLIDPKLPGQFNQAWMELGAMVCLPKQPQCSICPLKSQCAARRLGCEHAVADETCPYQPRRDPKAAISHPPTRLAFWCGKGKLRAAVWRAFGNCPSPRKSRRSKSARGLAFFATLS